MKRVNPDDLIGVAEITQLAHVSDTAVWKWRQSEGFPRPLVELKCGPIFSRREIISWLRKRTNQR